MDILAEILKYGKENQCETIKPEHLNAIINVIEFVQCENRNKIDNENGYIDSMASINRIGGYTDYRDHRNEDVRELLRESILAMPIVQYIRFIRCGKLPKKIYCWGYYGGVSGELEF